MDTFQKLCLKSPSYELLIVPWEDLSDLPLLDLIDSTELARCIGFEKWGIWKKSYKASWEHSFSSRVKSGIFPGSDLCIPVGGHWTLDHNMVQSLCFRVIQAQVTHKFHVLQLATSKPFLEGHQSWDRWHEPQVLNVMRACPAYPQSGLWCALGTYQGVAQAMLTPVWLKPYNYSKTFIRLIELEGDCEHRLELEWKMFAQNMV